MCRIRKRAHAQVLIVLKREHNNKQAAFYNPFHVFEVEFTDYIRRREHTGELIKKKTQLLRETVG